MIDPNILTGLMYVGSVFLFGTRWYLGPTIILAAITLDDREILNYLKYYEYDAEQIARVMNSDINLIALKISHLIEMGYNLRGIECNPRFLR